MPPYRSYHQYRSTSRTGGAVRVGKIFLMIIAVGLLFFIVKGIFSSPAEPQLVDAGNQSITPTNTVASAVDSNAVNTNTSATNSVTNTNVNGAANTNTTTTAAADVDADQCDQVYSRGTADAKQVTLTFNVGTTKEGALPDLLAALRDAGVPADFFARGDVATESPELIKKISDAGFAVYNLTNTHIRATELSAEELVDELETADSAITTQASTGSKPFFRPPYGAVDDAVVATAAEAGYCTVTWTIDAMDWSSEYTTATSQARVLDGVANGSIILMQASNATTAEIVPPIVTALRERGYTLVDLPTLLDL